MEYNVSIRVDRSPEYVTTYSDLLNKETAYISLIANCAVYGLNNTSIFHTHTRQIIDKSEFIIDPEFFIDEVGFTEEESKTIDLEDKLGPLWTTSPKDYFCFIEGGLRSFIFMFDNFISGKEILEDVTNPSGYKIVAKISIWNRKTKELVFKCN